MIKTHEAWLKMLMASFMSKTENKEVLLDFSDILFRHFTWLENELIELEEPYNYDRDPVPIEVEKLSDLIHHIVINLNEIDLQLISSPDKALASRIADDIRYIVYTISRMNNEAVSAFSKERKYINISFKQEVSDSLTLFLSDEMYKQYELIMTYNYLKAHSSNAYMNRIFQILIDESFSHLKIFGNMEAEIGILTMPPIVKNELYQINDVLLFLENSINEAFLAIEKSKKLSKIISKDSTSLSILFDFIAHQKNYHVVLMKDALDHFEKKNND